MKYTIDSLIKLNISYNHDHIVGQFDVDKCNDLKKKIEDRDHSVPQYGDVVVCIHPRKGELYYNGHYQNSIGPSVCTQAYVPFVEESKRTPGKLLIDASGGYWTGVQPWRFKKVGEKLKTFCTWGHCGATGNGAVDFQANVSVWEYRSNKFY